MEAVAADRMLLIRASFTGSLLFVAGICTQLYLCGYSVLRFIKLPRGERNTYKFYLSIMLLIHVSTLVAFVVDCITKIDNFTNYAWISGKDDSAIPLTPAWVVAVGVGTLGLIHLIGDALLAWRCYIIWTHNRKVGLIPVIPYIALLGIGLTYLASAGKTAKLEASQTNTGPRPYFKYQAATFFLSAGVNMLSTTLICIRLSSMARTIRRIADNGNGPDLMGATSSYQRVMTILIESALPFGFFSLACAVVSYIRVGRPEDIGAFSAYRITYPLWTISVGLAPQLIIFRVINGKSWVSNPTISTTRVSNVQSIRFAPRPESQEISMDARKGPRWQEASVSKAGTSLA